MKEGPKIGEEYTCEKELMHLRVLYVDKKRVYFEQRISKGAFVFRDCPLIIWGIFIDTKGFKKVSPSLSRALTYVKSPKFFELD